MSRKLEFPSLSIQRLLTDERKEVVRKLADTVDVGRHQVHNLCLAREVSLIVFFLFLVRGILVFLGRCRRGHIFANESLLEKDRVQLNAKPDLDSRCGERKKLSGS